MLQKTSKEFGMNGLNERKVKYVMQIIKTIT